MSYQEPDWAQPPNSECWYLVEIKSGVETARHALSRKCTLLGRADDMVHIPVRHESASRQHARIAFDSQGIPWFRDLKSTHGTTCNKRKLPAEAIGKVESNSQKAGARGVMLFPGDILQFGASTRLFCLEGPPEFERGAFKAKQQQESRQTRTETVAPPIDAKPADEKVGQQGVSWGIAMDDEVDQEETTDHVNKTLPMDVQVPEKHRKALERLNALKYKLANLETEDGRIRRKGELTTGQERQLQRNTEREEALKRSIVELETDLYNKLHPDKAATHRPKSQDQAVQEDDEDEFFDRTKKVEHSGVDDEESESSLTAKWNIIHSQERDRKDRLLPRAQSRVASLSTKLAIMQTKGDDEAFFVKNDLQLEQEALDKLLKEQLRAQETLTEIERLLKIVNPKLYLDRESGYIGDAPPPPHEPVGPSDPPPGSAKVQIPAPQRPPPNFGVKAAPQSTVTSESSNQTMLPPPRRPIHLPGKREMDQKSDEPAMPPPPGQMLPPAPMAPTASIVDTNSFQTPTMPPPKRKRVVGPSMPPPPAPKDINRQTPSPQGTLAFLSARNDAGASRATAPTHPQKQLPGTSLGSLDAKKDEWRAPEGQDGSGLTKLNAKFAGRY